MEQSWLDLPRRRLSFTESCVIFDCAVMRCHETLAFPMQNGRDTWESSNFSYPPCRTHQNAFDIIRRLSEYSGRQLTYSSGHLDGFWGVLKAYERWHSPGQHHWGVPVLLPKGTEADSPCTAKTPVCTLHLTLRTSHFV